MKKRSLYLTVPFHHGSSNGHDHILEITSQQETCVIPNFDGLTESSYPVLLHVRTGQKKNIVMETQDSGEGIPWRSCT
jgi:hypothetical protein